MSIKMIKTKLGYVSYNEIIESKEIKKLVKDTEQRMIEKIEKNKETKHPGKYTNGKCIYCGENKNKEHLGACDFLLEANKNDTIYDILQSLKQ